jgi:PAS domain S-box-containing protein
VTLGIILLFTAFSYVMIRRMVAMDKLREQNLNQIQSIIDALPLPIYFKDCSGRYMGCNSAFERFTGVARDDLSGKSPFDLYPENTASELVEVDARLMLEPMDSTWTSERKLKSLNGEERDLVFFKALFQDGAGGKGGLVGCILDVTDERRAVERLRESERNYRELVENANSIILRLDPSGMITFMNEFALKFFGYAQEEIIGKPVLTLLSAQESGGRDLQAMVDAICKDPESYPLSENENITRDGKTVWVSWANRGCYDTDGKLVEILSIGQDITERKRLQDMMLISEKMMTMGGLAAGMAHELNNPLGGILQNAQNMARRFSPELAANRTVAGELGVDLAMLQEYMKRRGIYDILSYIAASSERAADIVAKMLAFSRGGEDEKQSLCLREIVERSIDLASCDYDLKKRYNFRNIRIIRDYGEDLPEISINPFEIEQVLLSLLKNAAQAISGLPEDPAGHRITIRARQEGHYAVIDLEDDGPGVPPELRTRIFEPFFTSREIGSGTGLGLSVSYAIIANNHGSIFLDPSYTNGARFTIRLPLQAS